MRFDVGAHDHGVGEFDLGGVEHLAGDGLNARVVGVFHAVLAVTNDGVTDASEVSTNLVGTARFDA